MCIVFGPSVRGVFVSVCVSIEIRQLPHLTLFYVRICFHTILNHVFLLLYGYYDFANFCFI